MYVGATWMHPAARAELHLHGEDPQARIVGTHLANAGIALQESMLILAFAVPNQINRQAAKLALIATLADRHMLSERYFGLAPDAVDQPPDATIAEWARTVVATIQNSSV
jgi:hypothetical protein